MKSITLLLILVTSTSIGFCQTTSISGTVKNAQGQPVPLAFLRDGQHNYATYADSTGAFLLKIAPSSTLIAIAPGYADKNVKVENPASVNIIMDKGISSAGAVNEDLNGLGGANAAAISLGILNKRMLETQSGNSQIAVAGFTHEPTRGSPYLFVNWVHGLAISTGDSLLYTINSLYNYDKITGNLVFTTDGNNIMKVNNQGIKYFSLFNGELYPHVFENAPEISNKSFVEVLVSTPKYKVYKQTDTKLMRADFHTDGVIESGHKYDEYVDAPHYYFVKLPGGKARQFSLKKKSIKELFGGDADKFIESQSPADIDDNYLRRLNYSLGR